MIAALSMSAALAAPIEIEPYGILKPTIVFAASPVESFGRPNPSAGTAAGNPALAPFPGRPEVSFQVAQSRLGVRINPKSKLRGVFEIDFIDFDKSSPTTTALPRLRQALVTWAPDDHNTIAMGQTWDLAAPRMPHHYELVGAHFQAGNLGFMRHQLEWLHDRNGWETAFSLGFPGANGNPAAGPFEFGLVPTVAARLTRRWDHGEFAIAGLGTSLSVTPTERRAAWVGVLSAEWRPVRGPEVRAEAYLGQNTANLGMLTLGQGRAGVDIPEVGGWISARGAWTPSWSSYLTIGGAAVLEPDRCVPSYRPATETSPAARDPAAGPGMLWNTGARAGLEGRVSEGAAWIVEGFVLASEHRLDGSDADLVGERVAPGGQTGFLWRF